MSHVKQFLIGLVVIGMLLAPLQVSAQSRAEGWELEMVHAVALRHHIVGLNAVLAHRKGNAIHLAKAAASAEMFLAVMNRAGHTAIVQAQITKALQYGRGQVDKVSLGEKWDELVAKGMSTRIPRDGFIGAMSQLYWKPTPEQIEDLRLEGGLERAMRASIDGMNRKAIELQLRSVSYSGSQKGRYQKCAELSCGFLSASLGVVAAILAGVKDTGGCVQCGAFASMAAVQAAFMALLCEIDGNGDGVNFDACWECTAGLTWEPAKVG